MKITLLLFGITTDLLNKSSIEIELEENCNVSQLKHVLIEKYPQLENINSYAIAVNEEYATNEKKLHTNDVVAIIPPVSGG
jgi:molybdopterin converting factor subunit 1